MPRAGIDVSKIIKIAIGVTEENGFDSVTLKEISKRLDVNPSSLYNHISGLSELKEKVASYAMQQLRDALVRSVMGCSGIEAYKKLGLAYIHFAQEHPYLYETIQWMNIAADVEVDSLFHDVVQLVYDIGAQIGMDELEASHIIRTVRGIAQGFAAIELHNGFAHESSVESSYEYAVETLMLGVETRRKRGSNAL